MDTKIKKGRPDWVGYRYLAIFHDALHARFAHASQRPAADAFVGDSSKKGKRFRKALKRFRKRHPKHPAVKLARDKRLDLLDLAVLFVLLRNSLRISIDAWPRCSPIPHWLLRWAGVPTDAGAVEYMDRFRKQGSLRRLGLVASHSKPDAPLLTTRFHPTEKALKLAFGETDVCETLVRKLPSPPRSNEEAKTSAKLLVWPDDLSKQMDRIVHGAKSRRDVLEKAGLLDRLPAGRGVHVLLQGPPGTGKTLAARTLAARLDRPLRLLHGPDIQSMWVGQAEKTVREIYRKAQCDNVVLCIDEIDALIVSRDAARHSWERSLVDAFLVEMESFEGTAVYTTNRAASLDSALERRLTFRLEVPRPGPNERRKIWAAHLPDSVPMATDVNLDALADHDLSGGEILNAVLAALTEASMREPLQVTASDLALGVRIASEGRWSKQQRSPVGFGR